MKVINYCGHAYGFMYKGSQINIPYDGKEYYVPDDCDKTQFGRFIREVLGAVTRIDPKVNDLVSVGSNVVECDIGADEVVPTQKKIPIKVSKENLSGVMYKTNTMHNSKPIETVKFHDDEELDSMIRNKIIESKLEPEIEVEEEPVQKLKAKPKAKPKKHISKADETKLAF